MSQPGSVRPEVPSVRRYLAAFGGFQSNVKRFLLITAFRGVAISGQSTIINLYLYSLGYDARLIGLLNAANALAILVISVPLGYLSDRIGRRPVLLVTGVLYPFSVLGLGLVHSIPLLLLFMLLFGFTGAGYWVGGVPLLYASTREEERVQAFSVNSFLLWGLGPLGAFLSGQVVEIGAALAHVPASSSIALRDGIFFLFVVQAVGSIPYLLLREPPVAGRMQEQAPPLGAMVRLAIRLLLPDVVLAFGIGAVLTFSQLYFHLRFHLDAGPIGIIMAAGGVVAGLGTLSTPFLARRWGNLHTTVGLQWVLVPLISVLAVVRTLVLAIPAYWLVVSVRGMADPVYNAFIQERVPERYRGRLTGLYSVTFSIGFSLGPAASGQLQTLGGFTPAFLLGAGCYLLGSLLLYAFFGRSVPAGRQEVEGDLAG